MVSCRAALPAALSGLVLLFAGVASAKPPAGPAGPRDKAVLRLDDEALGKDYLETNFIKAEKKLQSAIGQCGSKNCSVRVLAQLHRDLAVVHVALGKLDAGKADLRKALELDPELELDPDYITPDLKKVFAQLHPAKAPREEVKPVKKKEPEPVPDEPPAPPPCEGDACGNGGEAPPGDHARNNWLSLSIQQDFALIGAGAGVCSAEIQVFGSYSCFRAAGSQYHGNPVVPDPGDDVNGGLAPATTRILVGYDRVLVAGLTLGVRLGYVLRGLGPRADGVSAHAPLAFHAEGRLGYTFGSDVFSRSGVRPFVFVDGGVAQVDSHFPVGVHEDTSVPPPPTQIDNPPAQRLDAYRRMGQAFAGGGAGVVFAFTPAVGLGIDAKYAYFFPTGGHVLSPELSFLVGF